jgi:hypothetical protein
MSIGDRAAAGSFGVLAAPGTLSALAAPPTEAGLAGGAFTAPGTNTSSGCELPSAIAEQNSQLPLEPDMTNQLQKGNDMGL